MTLWVDSRVGSKELLTLLRRQGLTAELTTLDAADFAFEGNGPGGRVQIGIERKAINDLVGSLRSGRLQGHSSEESESQVDRLHKAYDVVWLLVEGLLNTDRKGALVSGGRRVPGGFSEDSLSKALLSLELRGGLHVKQTAGPHQSAAWLASLFRWWTDKGWNAHSTLHTPMRRESMTPLSTFRDIVMRLPGVGVAASLAVERFCTVPSIVLPEDDELAHPSLSRMLRMSFNEWANLEVATPAGPRKLGNSKAMQICEAIRRLR